MAQFGLIVMSANLNTELYLFDLSMMLFPLLFLLCKLVLIFSKISNAADWRCSIGRNLDEVEAIRFRLADGILCAKDAKLLAGGTNDNTNFASANSFVNADEVRINKLE